MYILHSLQFKPINPIPGLTFSHPLPDSISHNPDLTPEPSRTRHIPIDTPIDANNSPKSRENRSQKSLRQESTLAVTLDR